MVAAHTTTRQTSDTMAPRESAGLAFLNFAGRRCEAPDFLCAVIMIVLTGRHGAQKRCRTESPWHYDVAVSPEVLYIKPLYKKTG